LLEQQNDSEEDNGVGVGTTEDFPEVQQFLGSISLADKYMTKFTENGIEDMETILELNDTHLDALGVPLGYKLKILKRIKAIRSEEGMTEPESRQSRP
jgi:hypothetical protein